METIIKAIKEVMMQAFFGFLLTGVFLVFMEILMQVSF